MERNQRMARLFRAISGKTQEQFGNDTGIHPVTIADIERGKEKPGPRHLELMARDVGLSAADGEELLQFSDTLRKQRVRLGSNPKDFFSGLDETLRTRGERLFQRLLSLPLPGKDPKPEDRPQAAEQMAIQLELDEPTRSLLVRVTESYQTWALAERVAQASLEAVAQDLREARAWAALAVEIAKRVRGTDGWRKRVHGFALAHQARVMKAAGDGEAAEAAFEEAKKLWQAGADPDELLDGGRVFG